MPPRMKAVSVKHGVRLITLETDKASMEVPAPKGGVVKSMKISEGDKVNEGDLLLECYGRSHVEGDLLL